MGLHAGRLQRHHAPYPRGRRRLVRLRRDALRPVALPLREQGEGRERASRRLHLGGRRSDARLVLHAARRVHDAHGEARLHVVRLPGIRPRQARQEDVEVASGEHRRPLRDDRKVRRRRRALAPPRPSARHTAAVRRAGPRRDPQPLLRHAAQRLLLLRNLREHRRLPRGGPGPARRSDRYSIAG